MNTEQPAYLNLHFRAFQEDRQWVSECAEFGVASCGDTLDEAVAAILDAVNVHLAALREAGTLKQVIADQHIVMSSVPPVVRSMEVRGQLSVSTVAG